MLVIDHVVLGVQDLDVAGERLLSNHGLASVPGGRHSRWGTGNRIVPLGADHLESIGPSWTRNQTCGAWRSRPQTG